MTAPDPFPRVEARLAESLLQAGADAEALERAGRSVAGIPWSVRGNAALARGLARVGRCAEATRALARAEVCHADRCPDRPRERGWPEPLRELPSAQLTAARAEVEACAPATARPRG